MEQRTYNTSTTELLFFKFKSKVQDDGPADADAKAAWAEALRTVGGIGLWAQVVGEIDTAVMAIEHDPWSIDFESEVTDPPSVILPYLQESPRVIRLYERPFPYPLERLGSRSALDIYLMDVTIDPGTNNENSHYTPKPLEHLDDPLYYVPLHGCTPRRSQIGHGLQTYWPENCGDFKGVRTGWLTPTCASCTDGLEAKHEERQSLIVDWRDIDAMQRFKDPGVRCTGIDNVEPNDISKGTWEEQFMQPLEELKRAGFVRSVEHWTLEVKSHFSLERKQYLDKELAKVCRKYDRQEHLAKVQSTVVSISKRLMCLEKG